MKRLRDEPGSSPLLRDAQRLLDAIEPLDDSPERMQRVRRALDRPRSRAGALGRVPALVLSGLVVLFGASAFAAVRYIAARSAAGEQAQAAAHEQRAERRGKRGGRAVQAPAGETAEVAQAAPVAAATPAAAASSRSGIAAEMAEPESGSRAEPESPAPARAQAQARSDAKLEPLSGSPRAVAKWPTAVPADRERAADDRVTASGEPARGRKRVARAHTPAAEAAALDAAPAAGQSDESVLVHRAVQALRRDGDPALAARLLAQSRARSAGGPLAEEALSLQIEAASALGHDARARRFAREYLTRYPQGRYAQIARDALPRGSGAEVR